MQSIAIYKCRNCSVQFEKTVSIYQHETPRQFLPLLWQNLDGLTLHRCALGTSLLGVADLIGGNIL